MTRVVVRADAAPRIGSGHVMRCLALIEALRARGVDVELVGSGIPPGVSKALAAMGVVATEPVATHDLDATVAAARRGSADSRWVVVDGYAFDRPYMEGLLGSGLRVAWVDDLNAIGQFDCDLVVNPSLGAERCRYTVSDTTRVLVGGTYALLRRDFSAAMTTAHEKQPQIVVTLGGADPAQLTPDVIRAIRQADVSTYRVIVVVGPSNPNLDAVKAAAAGAPHVTVVHDPPALASRLAQSTFVIAAAGTMTWELCALGIPTILLVAADNQLPGASAMREAAAAEVMDARNGVDVTALSTIIARLGSDAKRRGEMAVLGRRLIDGGGAQRAARWIVDGAQPGAIAMRPAVAGDALQVWRINSEPSVRAQSLDPSLIRLDRHFGWFDRVLAGETTRMYVFARQDEIAAVVRYERIEPERAELSFAVGSPFRRLGLGTRVLAESWSAACRDLHVRTVQGVVIEGNDASCAAFRRAGFDDAGRKERAGRSCLLFERRAA